MSASEIHEATSGDHLGRAASGQSIFQSIESASPSSNATPYSFRDDFNYASVNATLAAGWKRCGGAPIGFYSVSNGVLSVQNDGSQGAALCWSNIPIGIADWTVSTKVEWVQKMPNELGTLDMIVNTGRHTYDWMADAFSREYKLFRDGQFVWTYDGYVPLHNVWHTLRMDMHDGIITIFFDNNLETNYTETDPGTYLAGIDLASGWESTDVFDFVSAQQFLPSYPDFIVTPSLVAQNVTMGRTANFGIVLTSVNSFAGPVTIQPSSTSLPASGSPSQVILRPNGSNTSMITILTTSALQATYYVSLACTSGNLHHLVVFVVTITPPPAGEDFTISAPNPQVTVVQQDNGAWPNAVFEIELSSIGGFAGGVWVYVPSIWTQGSASITPNVVSVGPNMTSNATVVVTRNTGTLPEDSASIDIYVDGSTAGLTHIIYVRAIFQVPEFTMNAVPSSLAIMPGNRASASVEVTSVFFSGVVTLAANVQSFSIDGPTFSLSTNSVPITNNGIERVTLVVATSQNTPTQAYTIYINGTSRGRHDSATLRLVVISHPYHPGLSTGTTASYTLTISNSSFPPFTINLRVVSVSESNVSFSADVYVGGIFANSTRGWIDVATGYTVGPIVPFFLAPTNLNIGSEVYLDPAFVSIHITDRKSETSAGQIRDMVRFVTMNSLGQSQVTWDRTTGILTGLDVVISSNSTTLAVHYLLVSTDAWTSLRADFDRHAQLPLSTLTVFTPSVDGGAPPYTFFWSFGDGASSTQAGPSHLYSRPGSYTVTLKVTDSMGNTVETNQIVTVTASSTPTTPTTPYPAPSLSSVIQWVRANLSLIASVLVRVWIALLIVAAALFLQKRSHRGHFPSSNYVT